MNAERAGQRCLVTGASGYIGGRLVPELLASGHHVRCLARSPPSSGITRGPAMSRWLRAISRIATRSAPR